MLLLGSGQSGDGFVVPEGKNVPTSGRFNVQKACYFLATVGQIAANIAKLPSPSRFRLRNVTRR